MRDRKRILHFVSSFRVGGTERHVAELVRHHDPHEFDVHVGCFAGQGELLPETGVAEGNLSEYPVYRLYGPRTWKQQLRLARYLRSRKIQLLHAYGFYGNCFAIPAAFLARVPVVVASIRDTGASWSPRQLRVERLVCRLADAVLTNAEAVKQALVARRYPADRIAVIRNGIDCGRFQRGHSGGTLRHELGIPPDAPLVGAVARIDRVKGLEHFIDAAAAVCGEIAEARFVIIGGAARSDADGNYRRLLERRVEELSLTDRVFFAGNRADVPTILPQLSVSVSASLTEGLPNVVLESMASGVPTVSTDVGGTGEIIEHGVNGLLVAPRDSGDLARRITQILRDPEEARRLASNGFVTATSTFSVEEMVRSTESFYRDLFYKKGLVAARQTGLTSEGLSPTQSKRA